MQFEEISKEQLAKARPGLDLVEQVLRGRGEQLEMYLYGLTNAKSVLMDVQEALADQFDEEETEQRAGVSQLTEVALCIPISDDVLRDLFGSGWRLHDETFAYISPTEGARTYRLYSNGVPTKVTDEYFTVLAIADADTWIDDFLTKHGTKASAPAKVQRTAPATKSPNAPANSIDDFLNA